MKTGREPVEFADKIIDGTAGTFFTAKFIQEHGEEANITSCKRAATIRREIEKCVASGYTVECGRLGVPGRPKLYFGQMAGWLDPTLPFWKMPTHDSPLVETTNNRTGENMEIPVSKTEFEAVKIDEGMYPAKLLEVKDVAPGEFGDRVVLVFGVLSDDEVVELGMVAYKKLSPKSKLGEAFMALGAELKDDMRLDTTSFVGKKCQVLVENYTDKAGQVRSGISKVKPPKKE